MASMCGSACSTMVNVAPVCFPPPARLITLSSDLTVQKISKRKTERTVLQLLLCVRINARSFVCLIRR